MSPLHGSDPPPQPQPGRELLHGLGCYLHGSMRGYIYVSESPWAVKTSAEGLAVFEDLPDGPAQVRVWQGDQLIDLPTQRVIIGAAPAKSVVQLSVVPRRRRI